MEQRKSHKEHAGHGRPRVEAKASAYVRFEKKTVDAWFKALERIEEKPNKKQWDVSFAIRARCQQETHEERRAHHDLQRDREGKRAKKKTRSEAYSEPLRFNLQGLPGAGKSKVIKWIRSFFEECLGWCHGCEFVFLAPQNTMAALIQCFTLHSFGNIPINMSEASRCKDKSWNTCGMDPLFLRCHALRWVIIDEVSSASA